jgi:hypothetical protein
MTYRERHIAQLRTAGLRRRREQLQGFVASRNNTAESLERYEYELRQIDRDLDMATSSDGTIAR